MPSIPPSLISKIELIKPGALALLGIPSDENSTFLRGSALAPGKIREAWLSDSTNMCTENVRDLGEEPRLIDLGDLHSKQFVRDIEYVVGEVLAKGAKLLSLGGDHAITYPIVKAFAKKYKDLTLLHLDAHPDLYHDFAGNPHSHASPMARIMENGLAKRLVQVGIRTLNPHQQQQAKRYNVEIIDMKNWDPHRLPQLQAPVYITLDMDVLDPAFAPGISHHEPGGLSTREVLYQIQNIEVEVVGADIVELNPTRDPLGITAMVAAKFLKEIINIILSN